VKGEVVVMICEEKKRGGGGGGGGGGKNMDVTGYNTFRFIDKIIDSNLIGY
jgi:hypothetical protein